jgi:rhodanese-related sulfurtransferase
MESLAMATPLRITVDELRRRMDAGEDFTILDDRNPQAWSQSDTMIPESIRVPSDELERNLARIPKTRSVVAYCT